MHPDDDQDTRQHVGEYAADIAYLRTWPCFAGLSDFEIARAWEQYSDSAFATWLVVSDDEKWRYDQWRASGGMR